MTGFYSHLVQNCRQHVKVMTEVDGKGATTGVESVKLPQDAPRHVCPLVAYNGDKLKVLAVEGSSILCNMDCVFRSKEAL